MDLDLEFDFEPATEFQWDDNEVPVSVIPDEYQPRESETFASLLKMSKEAGRKVYQTRRMSSKEFRRRGSDKLPELETKNGQDDFSSRESINQTYRDFLAYKQNRKIRNRIKEYESLGFKLPHKSKDQVSSNRSFEKGFRNDSRRRYTLSGFDQKEAQFIIDYKNIGMYDEFGDEGPIDWDDRGIDTLLTNYDDLTQDKYYPGILDDAINRKIDYYKIAFIASFGSDGPPDKEPEEGPPLSLVEAFDMRVAYETDRRQKDTAIKERSFIQDDEDEYEKSIAESFKSQKFISFLRETRSINREEILLANAVEVDLANVVHNRPDNELINAINSLFKAELMNDYDKSMQAAEEAYSNAPPHLAETMAVSKVNTFKTTELNKAKTFISHDEKVNYNPIEIISYMGVTKPTGDEKEYFGEKSEASKRH